MTHIGGIAHVGRRSARFQQAQPRCGGTGLSSCSDAELSEDRRDMVVDRTAREEEPIGDLRVPEAGGNEPDHLHLSVREVAGSLARARSRATSETTDSTTARESRHEGDGTCGAEVCEIAVGSAQGVLVASPRCRQRGLVGAAECTPGCCGRVVFAGELERERLWVGTSAGSTPARRSQTASCPAAHRSVRSGTVTSPSFFWWPISTAASACPTATGVRR